LRFDLMFDVQTRKHVGSPLPPQVNRLIAPVILLILAAICEEMGGA